MLEFSTRLEANAIIERLVADGETFPADAARRLIDLVPVTRPTRVSFLGKFSGFGSGFRGHAAGVGDVELEEVRTGKTVSVNAAPSHKVGGYTMTHTPGLLAIELMWAETKLDQSGLSCLLDYDRSSKRPMAMRIAAQKTLDLFIVSFGFVAYVPWKRPE